MTNNTLYRLSGIALAIGALVGSITTVLELIVSPYNPHGSLLSLNAPVHAARYVAGLVLLIGLTGVYLRQRERIGKLGFFGFLGLFFGFALAGMPYTVIEFTMDPSLSQAEAAAYLDRTYENTLAFQILAGPGFLMFLLGTILFAIGTLRANVLPRWTGWLGLASLAVGIVSLFLAELLPGLVPHPPAWMLLGLIGYGYAVAAGHIAVSSTKEPAGLSSTLNVSGALGNS